MPGPHSPGNEIKAIVPYKPGDAPKGNKMKLLVYAIRDTATEHFYTPFYQKTKNEALRTFEGAVNDSQTALYRNPEHFDLYELGSFDDNTGALISHKSPEFIQKAVFVHKKPDAASNNRTSVELAEAQNQ